MTGSPTSALQTAGDWLFMAISSRNAIRSSHTGQAPDETRQPARGASLIQILFMATTETIALQPQQSRVNILNRRMDASVLLVKALGGGWSL
jgi:outer membrane protein TolC